MRTSIGGVSVQATILLATFALEPRRYKAIYYSLQGKQTISNLFASHEYGLLDQFHLYPKLKWNDYQAALSQLEKEKLVIIDQTRAEAKLTSAGLVRQTGLLAQGFWLTAYRYWQMGPAEEQWERLLLAVQVVSNYQHQIVHYQPLTEHLLIQRQVKAWLKKIGTAGGQNFVLELGLALAQLPEQAALIIANSFWSDYDAGIPGPTLAQALSLTPAELQLAQFNSLGLLLSLIRRETLRYPILQQLLPMPQTPLNRSADWTYHQVLTGKSWSAIVTDSRLKEGTLREHLLQAALLCPDFSIEAPAVQQLLKADPESFFSQRVQEIITARSSRTGGEQTQ